MLDRISNWAGARHCRAPALRRHLFNTLLSVAAGWAVAVSPLAASPVYAAELEEIQERGYLIVAVKDNLRPLGFRNEAGQLEGLEIDLAYRLAEELLGRRDAIVFQPVANQDRLSAILNDEADLVIARLSVTGPRSRIVDFSIPYYQDGTALITRDSALQQLSELRGRRVAVLEGSSTIATIRSLLPTVSLVGVSSYEEALSLLESGQAIAFAGDASVLTGWAQDYPQYHLLPTLLSAEALCVAMPRGQQYDDLRREVNRAIGRLQQEGWLQERIQHWGLPR